MPYGPTEYDPPVRRPEYAPPDRQSLEDILFAEPTPAPEPTRQERLAQMLIGLGDIANIVQNRKPGRNLPTGYARAYGQERQAKRTQEATRGQTQRKERAAYGLQRLDVQETEQRRQTKAAEEERIRQGHEDEENIRRLRQTAASAGVADADVLGESDLLRAIGRIAASQDRERAAAVQRDDLRLEQEATSRQLDRTEKREAREAGKTERRDIEAEGIRKEQRTLLREAMSGIAAVKSGLASGMVVPGFGKPSDLSPKELRDEFMGLADRMGLDTAGKSALMKQVDQELFRARGISPPAKFDLLIPQKGQPLLYMSPDGMEFSEEPKPGWIDTRTGERVGTR